MCKIQCGNVLEVLSMKHELKVLGSYLELYYKFVTDRANTGSKICNSMSENTNSVNKINRLIVVGLGLIGSSLGLLLCAKGSVNQVIGLSRRESTLEIAINSGIVDHCVQSIEQITPKLGKRDMVVICVPTPSVAKVLVDIVPHLQKR